jgi:hypothetical protein
MGALAIEHGVGNMLKVEATFTHESLFDNLLAQLPLAQQESYLGQLGSALRSTRIPW